MCIIFFRTSCSSNSKFKLILAANRDEFYDRPTKAASYNGQNEQVLCGQDLQTGVEGGTWLGVNKSGKFAFLTNILVSAQDPKKKARGRIVKDYLNCDDLPQDYINQQLVGEDYREFNFVGGEIGSMGTQSYYFGKMEENQDEAKKLDNDTTHVIACTALSTKWRKKIHGKQIFDTILGKFSGDIESLSDELFKLLLSNDDYLFPDQLVQSQGPHLSEDFLKLYCSVCINGVSQYGTRTQTVVIVDQNNYLHFTERNRASYTAEWQKTCFTFLIK